MQSCMDDETMNWLLEKDNPSVRYHALTTLLDLDETDPEVVRSRRAVMETGIVQAILAQQKPGGYWGDERKFYLEKYSGTVWQLLILAELAADPGDARVRAACSFMLDHAQDRESHGFSMNGRGEGIGGRHGEVIPCLTGNMLFSLVRLGFLDDGRVAEGIRWICRYQRCDDGEGDVPAGWPYDRLEGCWGRHSCHMGVVKSLKALAVIPVERRTIEASRKIEDLTEYILLHHIYKKSHDLEKASKPGWLKFGFPLMYQTDVLEILHILTELGIRDPRMLGAIETVRAKRNAENRWSMENTFNGKMLIDIEKKGENSKWLTLRAVSVLRHWR